MFLYYQETDDQRAIWLSCPDAQKFREDLKAKCAPMVTVLSVSQLLDPDEYPEAGDLKYKGPLYFDIDNDDISVSIASAVSLTEKLLALGVDPRDIEVWLSGKKGLHLTIDAKVFSSGRAVTALPLVYQEIAHKLFVEGLDMAVYSAKRGRMWRQPNIKRANGRYKVPVSLEELKTLTPEGYVTLTSYPREIPRSPQNRLCTELASLFEVARRNVQKRLKALESSEPLSEAQLEVIDSTAGCIQKLIHEGDKAGSNFNQAAMQLAAFIKSKFERNDQEAWMPLVREMAENVKSASYRSKAERVSHLRGAVFRAFADPNFKFFKGALFSVIERCGECPICCSTDDDGELIQLDQDDPILARETGFYLVTDKVDKQLTTFVIEVDSFFTSTSDDGDSRRTGVTAVVKWGQNQQKIRIDDEAWVSRSNFVKAFTGIGNLAVYANDLEIQKMKHHIFSGEVGMDEVHEVISCGIHWMTVGRAKTLVYVEPDFSITSAWEQNTHVLATDDIQAPPDFYSVPSIEEVDKEAVKETILNLLKINDPHVVAQVLGWVCSCFIKQQIITRINQFPLLNLWGNASSGKSKTGALMCFLHGLDYEMRDAPLSLETTTPYAIPAMVGSSTTVPRIIDECNPTNVPRRIYDKFLGVAKAAWGGLEDSKGMLSSRPDKSAKVSRIKLTGPTIYMSEQPPERPALKTRSVMVGFTKRQRQAVGREEAFMKAFEGRSNLAVVGKVMLEKALHTLPKTCHAMMDKYAPLVPREVDVRAHYSFTVVLAGLDFFEESLQSVGIELSREIDTLRKGLLDYLADAKDEISLDKARSEADIVMEALSVMAAQPEDHSFRLQPDLHYTRIGDDLRLDLPLVFPQYGGWCRLTGERPVVRSASMLTTLLKGELYFKQVSKHPVKADHTVVVLSVGGLKAKGIQASNFEEMDT